MYSDDVFRVPGLGHLVDPTENALARLGEAMLANNEVVLRGFAAALSDSNSLLSSWGLQTGFSETVLRGLASTGTIAVTFAEALGPDLTGPLFR